MIRNKPEPTSQSPFKYLMGQKPLLKGPSDMINGRWISVLVGRIFIQNDIKSTTNP